MHGAGGKNEVMTNKQQFVALELGIVECWHEIDGDNGPYNTFCKKCGIRFPVIHVSDWYASKINPDLITWEGFGLMWEAMRKREDWFLFAESVGVVRPALTTVCVWIADEYINPTLFFNAVAEWLGWQEEPEYENIQCPVCGYYCLGKGGHGCIDKPGMFKKEATDEG